MIGGTGCTGPSPVQRRLERGIAGWRWASGYIENAAAAAAVAAVDKRALGRINNLGEGNALTERQWVEAISLAALPRDEHPPKSGRRYQPDPQGAEVVPLAEGLRWALAWEGAHPPREIDLRLFE